MMEVHTTATGNTRLADTVQSRGEAVPDYEMWRADDLFDRAQELRIAGHAYMTKNELIAALRTV